MKKSMIMETVQIALFGALALFFAVLMVLELLPEPHGLELKEPIKLTSTPITAGGDYYAGMVNGVLYNSSDDTLEIEQIRITLRGVRNGKSVFRTLELEGVSLPARTSYPIMYQWEDSTHYERISVAEAIVDGEKTVLENAESGLIGGMEIFFGVLSALFVILLVRACKIRYYLEQERRLTAAEAEAR